MKVVTLLATVHDRAGAIVKNLDREDFLIEEAGVPQTVRYFSRESDLRSDDQASGRYKSHLHAAKSA